MPLVNESQPVIVADIPKITANFKSGEKTSSVVYCAGNTFLGICIPYTFTPSNLYFFASITGSPDTFFQLTDNLGNILQVSTSATSSIINTNNVAVGTTSGIQIPFDPDFFAGIQKLVIYSSNPQATDQQVQLLMAPVLG